MLDTRSPDQLASRHRATDERRLPKRRATAESMASRQREISVSEFFTKNRHLLGFDNPAKALLTTVKEAVDNSLDACEEAASSPSILVEIVEVAAARAVGRASRPRFRVIVEDNGPGHRQAADPEDLRQAPLRLEVPPPQAVARAAGHRHQRGGPLRAADDGQAGASSRARPARAAPRSRSSSASTRSATSPTSSATTRSSWDKEHGTRVEIELVAAYRGGRTGVQEYLEQTVVANPHLALTYVSPEGRARSSSRA